MYFLCVYMDRTYRWTCAFFVCIHGSNTTCAFLLCIHGSNTTCTYFSVYSWIEHNMYIFLCIHGSKTTCKLFLRIHISNTYTFVLCIHGSNTCTLFLCIHGSNITCTFLASIHESYIPVYMHSERQVDRMRGNGHELS